MLDVSIQILDFTNKKQNSTGNIKGNKTDLSLKFGMEVIPNVSSTKGF